MNARSKITAAAAAAAAVLVIVTPTAFASGTSVQFDGAELQAKGAGVAATVTVTCDAYVDVWGNSMTSTPVDVTVTQALPKGLITSGTGEGTVACDSTPHDVTVLVVPSTYSFKRGSALAWVTPTFDNATSPAVLAGVTVKIR